MVEGRNELVEQLQLQLATMQAQLQVQEAERNLRRPYVGSVFNPTPSNCGFHDIGYNAMKWQQPLECGIYIDIWDYESSFSTQGGYQRQNDFYQGFQGNRHLNLAYDNPNNFLQSPTGFEVGNEMIYEEKKPNLEEILVKFMEKTDSNMDALGTQLKMLEKQVGQIVNTLSNQHQQAQFSINTMGSPSEHCKAIELRNGTSYEEPTPWSSKELQVVGKEHQVVQDQEEKENDEDQFFKSLEVESPTLFVNQPLQFHEDEDFTSFKECKVLNVVDPYLDTDNSTKACFFHFYLSSSFNFYDDLSNMELFEYDVDLDGAQDHHNPYDVSRIAKPPYYWVATYGTLKFDEKWPPPMPPP